MSLGTACFRCLALLCLAVVAAPVLAAGDAGTTQKVIYQTPFSSDPHWTTNSPSSDYWDPATGRYHFSLEPSTGNYAYTTIENMEGSFNFEYDITLERIDDGATFRFGVTGEEMDFNKGPNVITMFSNGKYGNIMSLHLVTVGAKQMEVNSENNDEATSGSGAYKGPTIRFALNKTYHVAVEYDDDSQTTTMRVSDKATGQEIWSYFIKTVENLHDMNRLYLGSRGDYGPMYTHATGYIDNVRLTKTVASAPPAEVTSGTPVVTRTVPPADIPTETPESPASALTPVAALGFAGICLAFSYGKRS